MKRILWLSQHQPQPIQLPALRRMFGPDVEIVRDPKPFSDVRDIVERYRWGGFDDLVVVVPQTVLDQLCQQGVQPLCSEMEQVDNERTADFTYRGRHYRFVRFRRALRVLVEYADEGPEAERRPDD